MPPCLALGLLALLTLLLSGPWWRREGRQRWARGRRLARWIRHQAARERPSSAEIRALRMALPRRGVAGRLMGIGDAQAAPLSLLGPRGEGDASPSGFWEAREADGMLLLSLTLPSAEGLDAGARRLALWPHALQALARRHPAQPLQGLVLCMAAADLLREGAERTTRLGRITQLAHQACGGLGAALPVHLVVTQMQALRGYAGFEALLPPEAFRQPWGMRHPGASHAARPQDLLDPLFEPLMERLEALRLGVMLDAPPLPMRRDMHEFVEQVRSLRAGLCQWLDMLTDGEPLAPLPRWQGLFFTASRPEAAFTQGLLGRMADLPTR
ncbi:type VI secretion system protein [uncultured Pseudacidovorax sp.]|uniref:type VI secretion system protein n=1 Tax=uncultured Pseudacidovorax sp. TaxID=679313 RepID=UPI0025F99666|nr:type VI secretion system protein [uncultured Pseudacidovorax sp.]